MSGEVNLQISGSEPWASSLTTAGVVPDPMILRAAELFLLGKSKAHEAYNGDAEHVWNAISKNLDGLLVFFDMLMTRDKIPLIDYEFTFPAHHFGRLLGNLAEPVHVDHDVYSRIKHEARKKLAGLDFSLLPAKMLADIGDELGAVGWEWYPDPQRPDLGPESQTIARFVLGGIIFGGYAQATGADHVLQSKRSRLFAELTVPQAEEPLWGYAKEKQLFERLRREVSGAESTSIDDFELAPTVLPHLLLRNPPVRAPQELLERALNLRESKDGSAYREWFRTLRGAWSRGFHDTDAESTVREVLKELKKRFPTAEGSVSPEPATEPIWGTKLELGIEAGAKLGHDKLPIEVKAGASLKSSEVTVGLPNCLRNWIVDRLPMKRHRKLLLRISLDKRRFDNLTMGLKKLWYEA